MPADLIVKCTQLHFLIRNPEEPSKKCKPWSDQQPQDFSQGEMSVIGSSNLQVLSFLFTRITQKLVVLVTEEILSRIFI